MCNLKNLGDFSLLFTAYVICCVLEVKSRICTAPRFFQGVHRFLAGFHCFFRGFSSLFPRFASISLI